MHKYALSELPEGRINFYQLDFPTIVLDPLRSMVHVTYLYATVGAVIDRAYRQTEHSRSF
jgi:hypothetical protein